MKRGYIKIWRKCMDSGMLQNPELWAFWCWCLLKASHKTRKQLVGFQEIILEPGQFIFGRKAAALELKISQQTVRTCVKHLEMSERITIKSTNKFSVISIVNWELYQNDEEEISQQSNTSVTSSQPTRNQQLTTNKNVKNVENEESIQPTEVGCTSEASASDPCPHQQILDLYHEILPELPRVSVWTPQRQALLRSRWKESKERQSLEWWRSFFTEKVKASSFLTGRAKEWMADLEWLVRPKNFPKVLEGKYLNGPTGVGPNGGSLADRRRARKGR